MYVVFFSCIMNNNFKSHQIIVTPYGPSVAHKLKEKTGLSFTVGGTAPALRTIAVWGDFDTKELANLRELAAEFHGKFERREKSHAAGRQEFLNAPSTFTSLACAS